ncbi:hypothetical protein KY386_01025 [Candidatus Parcubacteria bacterium]|nr:hypothetical protein [Candidatus Parcubacteria bacterium]
MQGVQVHKQTVELVALAAVVMSIVAFVAQLFVVVSDPGEPVYFALGVLMMVAALVYTSSATLNTIFGGGSSWLTSAVFSWFMSVLWLTDGTLQFAIAAFR